MAKIAGLIGLALIACAGNSTAQYEPYDPSPDPHYLFYHPSERGRYWNWSADTPARLDGSGWTADVQAKDEAIAGFVKSPDFESTRSRWEAALGMKTILLGDMIGRGGSLVFAVGVDAQGRPIPDVLPHTFMGVPVQIDDLGRAR